MSVGLSIGIVIGGNMSFKAGAHLSTVEFHIGVPEDKMQLRQ
jgi:hypothetical protein